MSRDYSEKLLQIRKAEGLTQRQLSEITGIALGTIRNYETGQRVGGAATVEKLLEVGRFQKYTLWLMTDTTAPAAGQIEPALSPNGQDSTTWQHSGRKTG